MRLSQTKVFAIDLAVQRRMRPATRGVVGPRRRATWRSQLLFITLVSLVVGLSPALAPSPDDGAGVGDGDNAVVEGVAQGEDDL